MKEKRVFANGDPKPNGMEIPWETNINSFSFKNLNEGELNDRNL